MAFVVKWGRERLHFPLPPPDTKLAVIRRSLAEYTHLPELSFKLVHAGAVMKDDNAPISAYSIRENSTLALIGSAPIPIPSSSPLSAQTKNQNRQERGRQKQEPKTEQSTIAQIRAEVESVRKTLLPGVDLLLGGLRGAGAEAEDHVQAHAQAQVQVQVTSSLPLTNNTDTNTNTNTNTDTDIHPTQTQEHSRLSELLLQSLLRLDAVQADGTWEAARLERKGAVREVQGLLERLDGGWGARER